MATRKKTSRKARSSSASRKNHRPLKVLKHFLKRTGDNYAKLDKLIKSREAAGAR